MFKDYKRIFLQSLIIKEFMIVRKKPWKASPDCETNFCPFATRLDFNSTNNVVEYKACVMGLQATLNKGVKELKVYGDLTLVIYQLRGEWKTRDSCLILYHKYITEMIKLLKEINFTHLPWEETKWRMLWLHWQLCSESTQVMKFNRFAWVERDPSPLCSNWRWDWWKAMVLWHPAVHQRSVISRAFVWKW